MNRLAGVGWRVDYTLSSSLLRSVDEPMVHLRLEVAAAPGTLAQPVVMSLSADKLQVLLTGKARKPVGVQGPPRFHLPTAHLPTSSPAELKQAQTLMSSLG